ncbi:hypothetical protein ETC03_02760 [Geobacillus sp. MMMUD3]|nr:hypothetical protein [Geobacillus sp. MMMUD3]
MERWYACFSFILLVFSAQAKEKIKGNGLDKRRKKGYNNGEEKRLYILCHKGGNRWVRSLFSRL